jgi:hypothetical protein
MNESLNYASSANLTSTFNLSDINSEFVDFTGIILNKSPGYIKQDSGFIKYFQQYVVRIPV